MIKVNVTIDGREFEIDVMAPGSAAQSTPVVCNGETIQVTVPAMTESEEVDWLIVDGRPYEVAIDPALRWIKAYDGMHQVDVHDRQAAVARPVSADGRVKAPIPGLITQVLVQSGDSVEAGQPIIMLEAMKMENEILAPRAGKVLKLNALVGKSVTLNEELIEIG